MGSTFSRILEPVLRLLPRTSATRLMHGRAIAAIRKGATPSGLPLPRTVHATLTETKLGEGRVIVIGDVHGCPEELRALLDKCEFRQGVDTAVFVGDLVNKGRRPVEAVHLVREIRGITVRGNHDEAALEVYEAWKKSGELMPSYEYLREFDDADAEYFREMPFSLSIPSHGVVVVHAGVVPGIPLEEQELYDLITMRHVDTDDASNRYKALPKYPRNAGQPWANIYNGPQHIIFGHHARRRLQPCRYATGIDTGCVLGDQLTAVVLPSLQELRARGIASGPKESVTLASLGGRLVSVKAREAYDQDPKDQLD